MTTPAPAQDDTFRSSTRSASARLSVERRGVPGADDGSNGGAGDGSKEIGGGCGERRGREWVEAVGCVDGRAKPDDWISSSTFQLAL